MGSGFRTWNGVDAWPFAEGVSLHAIGGDQLLLCNVRTSPVSASTPTRIRTPNR
jgi:hypothetical protein